MSNSSLIRWFEQLLFGSHDTLSSPPDQVANLILRMEAEHIPWAHIILQGGFTAFPYQVHGDLNNLIDHLEKDWLVDLKPRCDTRAVSKFWDQLQVLLAKRDEPSSSSTTIALPVPSRTDDAILKDILEPPPFLHHHHHPPATSFQSAEFWGQVARRFIHLRRPETAIAPLQPLPPSQTTASKRLVQRIIQLYDMTCVARGRSFDPFTLQLVHHAEHVNAAHWQTPANLEAFMHDQPAHPLSRSVQSLLKRTVDQVLHGEAISALLNPCPRLDAFLHNVRVIHQSVEQVPYEHDAGPPRLIDVLQRLLALCRRDTLWEKVIPPATDPRDPFLGTSLMYLTEQLRMAEREKRLLWQHLEQQLCSDAESGPSPSPRICSDSLYAKDSRW